MKAITDTDGRRLEVHGGRFKGRDRLLEVVRIEREGRERDGCMWKHLHLRPAEALRFAGELLMAVYRIQFRGEGRRDE